MTLTVEDVSCTEVWLKISASGRNGSVIVQRDSIVLDTLSLNTTDTTITDTGLKPSHTYTYKVILTGQVITAQAVTMDTTSHNFIWTKYTFGGNNGSSSFSDIAIINDTLAYAVGTIYSVDSAGQADPILYNAAMWNGTTWKLKRITTTYNGNEIIPQLDGIFAFSATDIWLVGSSLPIHGDGKNWTIYDVLKLTQSTVSLLKAWGPNLNSMYFVGLQGSFVHYDGTSWTKIESGTTIDLTDVWGSSDGSIVWMSGYSAKRDASILLQYNGTQVQTLWTSSDGASVAPYGNLIGSVWSQTNRFVICSNGVFKGSEQLTSSFHTMTYRIRGNTDNDVIATGDDFIWHYNGASGKKLLEASSQPLYSVAIKNNTIMAVGMDYASSSFGAGVIYIGDRMP